VSGHPSQRDGAGYSIAHYGVVTVEYRRIARRYGCPTQSKSDPRLGAESRSAARIWESSESDRADAAFLVEEVEWEEASRYGVCDTNKYGEVTEVVEKPDDPPSNLVMTGFYTFTPAIFHTCHLVQPPNRGECEISEAIDLLIRSGRTIDAIGLEGRRIDVGYPEDREKAEDRLSADERTFQPNIENEIIVIPGD